MKEKYLSLTIFLLIGIMVKSFGKSYISYGFVENKGQIIDQNNNLNPSVKYLWTGNGMKVQLKGNSFSYEVLKIEKFKSSNPQASTTLSHRGLEMSKHSKAAMDDSTVIYSHRVDIELLNANPHPQIIAEEKSNDYDNYYTTGTPEEGVTFVYHYNKVTYKDIYPNIDLEFLSDAKNENGFKYNFIVHLGGNVADIQLQYKGATYTTLNKQGNLAVATTSGDFEESIPKSYVAETGENVTVQYATKGGNVFGFQANTYAPNQTLIIDPWCTYYGTYIDDVGLVINSDTSNNLVIVGHTQSTNNIASANANQNSYAGNTDVFIVKFTSSGTRLFGTYFGGSMVDGLGNRGMIIDKWNNIIVTGHTNSITNIATNGTFQSSYFGIYTNGFVAKFNALGYKIWGSYFGSQINPNGICSDTIGSVFITGYGGDSNNLATLGTFQPNFINSNVGGGFIIKFDSSGNRIWGTYVWGVNEYDIKVDNNGNIYTVGYTKSNNNIATLGSYQTNYGGGWNDIVLSKFNSSGSQLLWRTYYGGNDEEYPNSMAINNIGNIILVGGTASVNNIASIGAFKTNITGGTDGFLAKFDNSGFRIWATYIGGNNDDVVNGVCNDYANNILLTGFTNSTTGIATTGAFQSNLFGLSDVLLSKYSSSGNRLWGTYFGGINNSADENGLSITSDKIGNIVITGNTTSSTNISTSSAFQTTLGGIFIASFDSTGSLTITPPVTNNSLAAAQTICSNVQPALLTGSSPSGGNGTYGYLWLQSTTNATSGFTAATGANNTQNYQPPLLSTTTWYKRVVSSGNAADTSATVQITVNAAPVANITAGGVTTFCQGNNVTLNANTGSGLSYQWYNGNSSIAGATNSNYIATIGGSYSVQIGNSNCNDTSNVIAVTVNPVPTASITAGGNTTICNGEGVNLNAQTGSGYTYQWYNNATILTGATNATYLANASGSYTAIVNLGSCSDTSNAIAVTVNALPNVSITQTVDTLYSIGSFNSYQWYYNGIAISGATNPNYTATQNGNYYVIVTDANNCSGQSNTILFTVGIDEVNASHLLNVSPNPFKESFVVKCSAAKGCLLVVDAVGKIIKSIIIKSGYTTVDMKGFASGIYIIKYENGQQSETVKLLKE